MTSKLWLKKKTYAPGAKDVCPFTRKPETRQNLVKLTPENIEEFKDKIINQEIALKECRKAGIKCGIIKQVRETYSRFQTPINFQLIEKKPHEYGQWKVILSDGLWKHEFIMSNKYDYVMSKIRLNIILTLNEIYKMKSKKGQPNKKMQVLLITSFFVPTKQQVKYDIIGNPKTLML